MSRVRFLIAHKSKAKLTWTKLNGFSRLANSRRCLAHHSVSKSCQIVSFWTLWTSKASKKLNFSPHLLENKNAQFEQSKKDLFISFKLFSSYNLVTFEKNLQESKLIFKSVLYCRPLIKLRKKVVWACIKFKCKN